MNALLIPIIWIIGACGGALAYHQYSLHQNTAKAVVVNLTTESEMILSVMQRLEDRYKDGDIYASFAMANLAQAKQWLEVKR